MAKIELTIRRDNGVTLVASGEVADEQVLDMCSAVGAMLFEAAVEAAVPVAEETVIPSGNTPVSG